MLALVNLRYYLMLYSLFVWPNFLCLIDPFLEYLLASLHRLRFSPVIYISFLILFLFIWRAFLEKISFVKGRFFNRVIIFIDRIIEALHIREVVVMTWREWLSA